MCRARPSQSPRHLCSGRLCAGRLVEARPESRSGPKGAEQGRSAPAALGMDALCGRPGMRDDQAGTSEPKQSETEHRVHGEHDVTLVRTTSPQPLDGSAASNSPAIFVSPFWFLAVTSQETRF